MLPQQLVRGAGVALCLVTGPLSAAIAQQTPTDIQGVELGVTPLRIVLGNHGAPSDSGRTGDGWHFVIFGYGPPAYGYYFSPEDSVVEFARVWVLDGYTAERAREAFGRPDTTEFDSDLSKQQVFQRGRIVVAYKPSGMVNYIEYHAGISESIGWRRAIRADAAEDSLIAATIMRRDSSLSLEYALDTVATLRRMLVLNSKLILAHKPVSTYVKRAVARFASLCTAVNCDSVFVAHRAYDSTP